MKERLIIKLLFSLFFTLQILISGCTNKKNPHAYLNKVLENLEQTGSATYFQTVYAYYNGDTIPSGSRYSYYKEFINLPDTSVGACFLEYDGNDTSRIIYGYDGTIQAWIDWDKKNVQTDDFKRNRYPFRVIMAPFMTYAKTIITYAFEKKDSITIVSDDYGDSIKYCITFYDQFLDFVGKIPVPVYNIPDIPDGSAKGKSTIYEILIDKSSGLPYRIKREMPGNMFTRNISKIETSVDSVNNFSVPEYFPPDFPMIIGENSKSTIKDLEGKEAPDWTLSSSDNHLIGLKDIKSKVLLIEFTGIGCGPCYKAIQFLKELVSENKNNDFELLSIEAWNKNTDIVKNYSVKNNLNYRLLISNPDVTEDYNVNMVPVFFIIDENRIIRRVFEGYEKGSSDKKIRESINDLF